MRTLHVGTYDKSGGLGLVPIRIGEDHTLTPGEPFAGAVNASFGERIRDLAYLVDEQDEGALTVLRETPVGWKRVAHLPTRGGAPCYVALDRDGTRLAVANYASGSVALFALDGNGLPLGQPALFQAQGSGPNEKRQEGPHAHCVRFSHGSEAVYVVDLGADQVLCLKLGRGAMFVEARIAWRAPPGTGPRHLLFHPRRTLALVLSELSHTLTLLEAGDGKLRPLQSVSTVPAAFTGDNLGGHLGLNAEGTRVYTSNRGHDSIAVFALENNRLELLQQVASGGAHPRHFVLLEDAGLLAVAHEKDGRIGLFEISRDGTLTPKGPGATVPGACFLLG
jgi:6-phosphogluconolactonase